MSAAAAAGGQKRMFHLSLLVAVAGAHQPVIERVWLNSILAYDSRSTPTPSSPLFHDSRAPLEMPFSQHQYSEKLGIVGPLLVQWTLLPAASTTAAAAATATKLIAVVEAHSGLVVASSGQEGEGLRERSWTTAAALVPLAQYKLQLWGGVTIPFRAGPRGNAGDPTAGWTASWVGGGKRHTRQRRLATCVAICSWRKMGFNDVVRVVRWHDELVGGRCQAARLCARPRVQHADRLEDRLCGVRFESSG